MFALIYASPAVIAVGLVVAFIVFLVAWATGLWSWKKW